MLEAVLRKCIKHFIGTTRRVKSNVHSQMPPQHPVDTETGHLENCCLQWKWSKQTCP